MAAEKSQGQPNPFKSTTNSFQPSQAEPSSSNITNPFKSWTDQASTQRPADSGNMPTFPTFQDPSNAGTSGSWAQPQENAAAPVFSFGSVAPAAPGSFAAPLGTGNLPNGFSLTPGNKAGTSKERSRRKNHASKGAGKLARTASCICLYQLPK